jgi:hypothetical protein
MLLIVPALTWADGILSCIGPEGNRVFQDHPCIAAEPVQPGLLVIPHSMLAPEPQAKPAVSAAAGCSAYARDWRLAYAQDRATISNRIGAAWSDRMRYDERYLRLHDCPQPY